MIPKHYAHRDRHAMHVSQGSLARNIVFGLARRVGMAIVDEPRSYGRENIRYPYWDGSKLLILPNTPTTEILHEICHYIEADDTERLLLQFGAPSKNSKPDSRERQNWDRTEMHVQELEEVAEAVIACAVEEQKILLRETQP